jgi:hypothetical protein
MSVWAGLGKNAAPNKSITAEPGAPLAQLPSSPAISCTSITILRRRWAFSIRMNAPISLKPFESETKSSIWAIDNALINANSHCPSFDFKIDAYGKAERSGTVEGPPGREISGALAFPGGTAG